MYKLHYMYYRKYRPVEAYIQREVTVTVRGKVFKPKGFLLNMIKTHINKRDEEMEALENN